MSEPAIPARPFYFTGGTMHPREPSYVERRADTDLYASLLAGEFCYVLTARQMGKSSLMARTAKRLEEASVASAIVDLTQIGSEQGDQAAAQWYFGIANKIHQQLRITAPLRAWWQERDDLSSVQRLSDFYRELVLAHVPGRVVVFVDEIDSTIGLPFADDFFAALRACFNARATEPNFERLTFVLLGVATPDQLIQDPARTPFNIGKRIDLTDFRQDEAQVLAPGLHLDPVEAGRRLERVLHWTGGHPYLTQALCHAVRERANTGTVEEAVDPQVEELFLSSRAQREEGKNLEHVRARLERPGSEGRRLLQLYYRVRQGESIPDQPTSPLFAQLKLTGVVKATDEGRLAVRNRIYETVFSPEWANSAMPTDIGRRLAMATLATAFAGVLISYAVIHQRLYKEAFEAAIKDNGYNSALDAYTALRKNPFSRSRAAELMQEFWERRALVYALAGQRDESLVCHLKSLEWKDNDRPRKQGENLVGPDYARLERTVRHSAGVRAVALSSDGGTILTGSDDATARLWNARTGQPLTPPLQHRGLVYSVAFSPNGEIVLTGSSDNTARLWNARTGDQLTAPLQHQATVYAVAFSPDGEMVLTGSSDNTARLWAAGTGQPRLTLRHQGPVRAVAFSRDGRIVTGSEDHTACIWNARTGDQLTPSLRQHAKPVRAVAFSPDGGVVLTGSEDHTARLWNAHTGKLLATLPHEGPVRAVAFSPDGRLVLTGEEDDTTRLWDAGTARLWDAGTGRLIARLQHQGPVHSIAFSPDGRLVLTGSSDNTARLWDARTGRPIAAPLQHQGAVSAVFFSPDGGKVLTGSSDKTARLWNAHPGQSLTTAPLPHQGPILAAAFSPDGRIVLTGDSDKTARLWDALTGKPRTAPLRHQGPVSAVAFSQDGMNILTGSDDKTARLWNALTGKPRTAPLQDRGPVSAVAFSPDGRSFLTVSSDDTARLWIARLWSPRTREPLPAAPLQHQGLIYSVAFSPNSEKILTGSSDGTARLWDAHSGQPLTDPLKHQSLVYAVAFSLDGGKVLTGSSDRTVRLWDAHSGQPLTDPLHNQEPIKALAFRPNGKEFFVATDHWLNTYSWDGQSAVPQNSQLLHGFWKQGFRFPSDCEGCLQAVLGDTGNSFHLETLRLDGPTDPPIEGDPKELLDEWRVRLGLKFDDQMKPVPR